MFKKLKEKWRKIRTKIHSKYLGWKIRTGRAPRGRTRLPNIARQEGMVLKGKTELIGRLYARVIRNDGNIEDLGLISERVVTDVFVQYLVDSMQDSTTYPMDVFKWHASGTGTTAESASDTALENEVESRAEGTQTEGSSANIYKSVATITYSASYSITEHGVFSASTGGTLLDRSVFSAINVDANDSIEFTYELTVNSGG